MVPEVGGEVTGHLEISSLRCETIVGIHTLTHSEMLVETEVEAMREPHNQIGHAFISADFRVLRQRTNALVTFVVQFSRSC